eukprot:gene10670-22267_t
MPNSFVSLKFLDPMSRILFIPWGITYLSYCLDESWPRTVAAYGLLCSSLTIGRLIGRALNSTLQYSPPPRPWFVIQNCLFLGLAYFTTAITTRFSVLFLCFFIIGLCGSSLGMLSSCPTISTHSRTWSRPGLKPENELYTFSTTLAFLPLLSGMFYNTSVLVRFPSLWICAIFAITCFVLAAPFIVADHSSSRKPHVPPLQGMGGGSWRRSATELIEEGGNDNQRDMSVFTASVPKSYLKFHRDPDAARKAYGQSLQWRRQHHMDKFLSLPQPHFDDVIQFYPHAIHGRSRDGVVVVYE